MGLGLTVVKSSLLFICDFRKIQGGGGPSEKRKRKVGGLGVRKGVQS